jgi:hypothetical protein
MYVRTTEVRGDPARIDDGIIVTQDAVFPLVTAMDGCIGMSLLTDHRTGRCVATTAWETEGAMLASVSAVRPLRERAEQALGATGISHVHQWEVAVVHRDHAAPDGACARLTWVRGEAGTNDHAVDLHRMVALHELQDLDGFCSTSFMIDRETGRTVSTDVFDSAAAIDAGRETVTRLHERLARELGATIEETEEMEVAFAHLHVPEMA